MSDFRMTQALQNSKFQHPSQLRSQQHDGLARTSGLIADPMARIAPAERIIVVTGARNITVSSTTHATDQPPTRDNGDENFL